MAPNRKMVMPGRAGNKAGNPVANKIINVGREMGVDLANQQGSTRAIYDTLPLDGKPMVFFAKTNSPVVGLPPALKTNVDGTNGVLGIGEGMALEYIYFTHIVYDEATDVLSKYQPVSASAIGGLASGFYAGNFTMQIETQEVLKAMSLGVFLPEFNATPLGTASPHIFRFMTNLVLMELLKFRVTLEIPTYTPTAKNFLRCTIQGRGGIYSAQNTF